jgi:hypothetical protein
MLDRGQRTCPGSSVVSGDEDFIGVTFGDAGRHGSDAHFGNELYRNTHPGIGAFEVVYQLSQILDGIDVVVRWRRDQRDSGRRMAQASDLIGDLMSR